MGGDGNLEHLRDLMVDLRGHKEMTPEMSQRLADLEDKARTSTIIQSVLGGLAGGLSNPYGGRFALGSSAAGALGGYQKGIGSEEEIGRKAFDVLRGYADAPAEEKAKGMDTIIDLAKEKMKLQSAADIAEGKGQDALYRVLLQGGFAQRRAETMAPYKDTAANVQVANLIETMTQNELKEDTNKEYYDTLGNLKPGSREIARQKAMRHLASQGIEVPPQMLQSGLGGGPLGSGSPLIITRQ